jgi:segregation and condensation protein B
MPKKKNKSDENEKTYAQADLTNLIDAAKNSLFELDDSYNFIEESTSHSTEQEDEFSLLESAFQQQEIQAESAELEGSELESTDGECTEVENAELVGTELVSTEVENAELVGTELVSTEVENAELVGTELEAFESAQIEELEFITEDQAQSVLESIFFATDRPVSIATIKQVFEGTNVTAARIRSGIENLKSFYASSKSGITLEDIGSGFQLRTKLDNMEFLRRSLKSRPFKLSGPALEVLAIVAYKQPIIKSEIDEIRGVESGHLLRALMEKNLCSFAGKSDLPGKPMLYETTRKFLEIFSLRNLKELPTLSQIDELLPEGIGDEADQKPKLGDITEGLSQQVGATYSDGEEELNKITGQLEEIQTTTEFFEKEKQRQKEQRDSEKAQNLSDAIAVGEEVSSRDRNWLKRFQEQKLLAENGGVLPAVVGEEVILVSEGQAETLGNDEFDELSAAMDAIEEETGLVDPEVIEANDIADIEN